MPLKSLVVVGLLGQKQVLQLINHVQLKQSLHGHISSMGHAISTLHVRNIMQLNLLCNFNHDNLRNTRTINSKIIEFKGQRFACYTTNNQQCLSDDFSQISIIDHFNHLFK
jgi:hypothetical protein